MVTVTGKAQVDVPILTFADAILHGDEAHRDRLMAAAEVFIASNKAPKKPKVTRLRSWLSIRHRVPHLAPAPDQPKVPSRPNGPPLDFLPS